MASYYVLKPQNQNKTKISMGCNNNCKNPPKHTDLMAAGQLQYQLQKTNKKPNNYNILLGCCRLSQDSLSLTRPSTNPMVLSRNPTNRSNLQRMGINLFQSPQFSCSRRTDHQKPSLCCQIGSTSSLYHLQDKGFGSALGIPQPSY